MEYLLYKFVISFVFSYGVSLIIINIWNGVDYILHRINHDDSEWIDEDTKNEVTEEN